MQRLTGDILALSLVKHSAPAGVCARVPAGAVEGRRMLDGLADLAGERLILHTCERFEVYAAAKTATPDRWIGRLAALLELEPAVLRPYVELRHGDEAARHLLRVAAGLESRLVGEPQIQGQVRQAAHQAREARALGPFLDALARAAIHAGRRARRETRLGQGGASIVSLALDRLRDVYGSLRDRRVIVCGTGSLAAELVSVLSGSGAKVSIASRTPARAQALAARFGAETIHRSELARALVRADALVACTHGVVPIEAEAVSGRRFAIVDLGMPPNVEPRVGQLAEVRLWGLDDLTSRVDTSDVSRAAAIVEEELTRFRRWCVGRDAAPLVAELLRRAPGRASPAERRALHLEIERLKAEAAA